ncbi:MAG: helix-turn-helix domain-containing protein [Flavobacteriales bacterium]|nr:helix-turn-helix domain-containing protein [Flavobacteriales bacterium]
MLHEYTNSKLGSIIGLTDHYRKDRNSFSMKDSIVSMLWNRSEESVKLVIDNELFLLQPNQIVTVTYLQNISFDMGCPPLHAIIFNREFYCILDHDEEVSCNGILFFGTQDLPIITLDEGERAKFNVLLQVFIDEFETPDRIQGEMLQTMLKRFIIKCVRLAKEQLITKELNNNQVEIIRKFNVLVDTHFKEKRHVKDYAELLFKSPKTLSNLFGIYNQFSPQQIIHNRLILEAKRLLHYTNLPVTEVGLELGYEDPAYFSRFFKKHTGKSPSEYKNIELVGS